MTDRETTGGMTTKRQECDYYCNDCGRSFHTKSGLGIHQGRIHE